jgi:hypothetical protein
MIAINSLKCASLLEIEDCPDLQLAITTTIKANSVFFIVNKNKRASSKQGYKEKRLAKKMISNRHKVMNLIQNFAP